MNRFVEEEYHFYGDFEFCITDDDIKKLKQGKMLYSDVDEEYTIILKYYEEDKALEQKPCEDAISREQAIRATYGFERYTGIDEAPYEYAESILRDLPPVTPQQKTGHWIGKKIIDREWKDYIVPLKDGFVAGSCSCSECGEWLTASDEYACYGRYCPNCGAKMESEDKE